MKYICVPTIPQPDPKSHGLPAGRLGGTLPDMPKDGLRPLPDDIVAPLLRALVTIRPRPESRELRLVRCSCRPGTEGTSLYNYGKGLRRTAVARPRRGRHDDWAIISALLRLRGDLVPSARIVVLATEVRDDAVN